ncbi:MAG: GNAT family N-acetyltransferase [Chloroflexi bacterium]|nr:GNAT family N-acetyltransferase [Chloroflexota bacterium]
MPTDVPVPAPDDDEEEEEEFEMEVRELEPDEIVSAAEMLARAFEGTTLLEIIAPDPDIREDACRWFFESHLVYGLAYGDVIAAVEEDGTVQAAAVWWAPENVAPDDEQAADTGLADGLTVLGPEAWERLQELGRATSALHKQVAPDPHWYLALIGVEAYMHGQGVGGEVLAASLEMVDEEGYPAYLETSNERTIPFYERHGFKVGGQIDVPALGMTVWGMRREPAGS